jgi:hypothetical protein
MAAKFTAALLTPPQRQQLFANRSDHAAPRLNLVTLQNKLESAGKIFQFRNRLGLK